MKKKKNYHNDPDWNPKDSSGKLHLCAQLDAFSLLFKSPRRSMEGGGMVVVGWNGGAKLNKKKPTKATPHPLWFLTQRRKVINAQDGRRRFVTGSTAVLVDKRRWFLSSSLSYPRPCPSVIFSHKKKRVFIFRIFLFLILLLSLVLFHVWCVCCCCCIRKGWTRVWWIYYLISVCMLSCFNYGLSFRIQLKLQFICVIKCTDSSV